MNDESCSNVILRKIPRNVTRETSATIFRSVEKNHYKLFKRSIVTTAFSNQNIV